MMPVLAAFTAQLWAERLLNSVPEGVALALLAWVFLKLVPRQNSGTRFAVWFSALLTIAALPLVRSLHAAAFAAGVHHEIMISGSWAPYIFAAWAFIASVALLRVATGFLSLRAMRRKCLPLAQTELDPTLLPLLRETRNAVVCTSDSVHTPTAIGFFHPMIVLPAWAPSELSADELKSVLLHELAHLRRRDDWTNLAQKILRALFFFHPAVWWVERQLALEREMACDDAVLASTGSPHAYAQCLVSLAEKSFLRRSLALAQAAVSRMRETSQRIAKILDGGRPRGTRLWKPVLGLLGAASVACLALTARAPQLIALQDPGSSLIHAGSGAAVLPAQYASYSAGRAPQPLKLSPREPQVVEAGLKAPATPPARPQRAKAIVAHRNLNANRYAHPGPQMTIVSETIEADGMGHGTCTVRVWKVSVQGSRQRIIEEVFVRSL